MSFEFNKKCAEDLGWRKHGRAFHIPNGTLDEYHTNLYMTIDQMSFGKSRDWCDLLEAKIQAMGYEVITSRFNSVDHIGVKRKVYTVKIWDRVECEDVIYDECDDYEDYPKLISQTCVEAIKRIKEGNHES